jgi:hypothetical protein
MQLSKKGEFVRALAILTVIPLLIGLRCGGEDKLSVIIILIILWGMPLCMVFYGLKKFKILIILNVLLSISLTITSGYYTYRPTTLFQILSLLIIGYLLIMIAINVFAIFWLWFQEYGILSLLPIIISLLTIPLSMHAGKIGHQLRMRYFKNHLTEYEQFVQTIEDQYHDPNILIPPIEIPHEYKHLAYHVRAKWKKPEILIVDFLWGESFPAKHDAFEYCSNASVPDPSFWTFHERINENWYRVGD